MEKSKKVDGADGSQPKKKKPLCGFFLFAKQKRPEVRAVSTKILG